MPSQRLRILDNLQRQAIKSMLQAWDTEYPGRVESIFRAMGDVVPSHLLDEKLYDFSSLNAQQTSELDVVNLS